MDALTESNLVPKAGDAIDFVGSLNISDEQSSMRLLSVKELHLTRARRRRPPGGRHNGHEGTADHDRGQCWMYSRRRPTRSAPMP